MKNKIMIGYVVAACLLAGCASEQSENEHKEAKQEKLMAQAKISKETAQETALARVPGGTIKESELEKEHGKIIWSFDVATSDPIYITEVNVDAITGDIVSVEKEKAEKEAKEN